MDLDSFSEKFISFMNEKSHKQRGVVSYAVKMCIDDIDALKSKGLSVADIISGINKLLDDSSKIHYKTLVTAIYIIERNHKRIAPIVSNDKKKDKIHPPILENNSSVRNIPNEWMIFNQTFDSPIPEKVIIEAISKGITLESIEEEIANIDDKRLKRSSALSFINNQFINRKFLK